MARHLTFEERSELHNFLKANLKIHSDGQCSYMNGLNDIKVAEKFGIPVSTIRKHRFTNIGRIVSSEYKFRKGNKLSAKTVRSEISELSEKVAIAQATGSQALEELREMGPKIDQILGFMTQLADAKERRKKAASFYDMRVKKEPHKEGSNEPALYESRVTEENKPAHPRSMETDSPFTPVDGDL